MSLTTACPLDCYDACEIKYENGDIKASSNKYTSGFLCPHLNHYKRYETILVPKYKGEVISLDQALIKLKDMIYESDAENILHYRSHGNFGLMQEVMDHFFASYGATLTNGSLCDGAGEAGIIAGRGSNKNMPLSEIEKSEVVVIWGRNPHTTSSHLLPILKNKIIIVIDPVKTKLAKSADLHIQIKPHSDAILAMIVYKFLDISEDLDMEYIKKYANDSEEYMKLINTLDVDAMLLEIGVSLDEIFRFTELLKNKKVALVCGLGIQKYSDGADAMRAVDALAVGLGLFGKEGCGVAYLGNSKEGVDSPFYTQAKRISKVKADFGDFTTVFVQCANPVSQMPDTKRVKEAFVKVKNLVYFGLFENETSELADLIIPAKTFLAKNDIRTSYSHNLMLEMPKMEESNIGICEYDLSAYLCQAFNIQIQTQEFYLEYFKKFSVQHLDGLFYVENRDKIPYKEGFDTDDGKFIFLNKLSNDDQINDELFLLTPKSSKSLNSQFKRKKNVYLHESHGFKDCDVVCISSSVGDLTLNVKVNNDIRKDCVLIYSGTVGVNNLTSSKHSLEGQCAIYQEEKVKLKKVG